MGDNEHILVLFADDNLVFLETPDKCFPVLMKLLETYGHLSGYRLKISKTQVLTFNYEPSRKIQNTYNVGTPTITNEITVIYNQL